MKLKKTILTLALLTLPFASIASAHSGRTDANGGHNCSAASVKKGLCTGYHYHNGGSTGGSSSSSNSKVTTPAPVYTPPKEVIPAGQVKVTKPSYSIYVNGTYVPNSTIKYPIISYNDVTYFPMTFKFTQALGIETSWDTETGFVVRKTSNEAGKLEFDNGSSSTNLYAKNPDFNVYVNDAWIDNENEEFPILVFNDVTYFPMTWNYAVDELGLTIKNENNSFYISK